MAEKELIQYVGDNNTLVHKFTCPDLKPTAELMVHDSQEAVFYKNGQALDVFPGGIHSLKPENVPFLKRVFGAIFGGPKTFPCDIFFVNKVSVLDIVWGTDSPIQLEDPKYPMLLGVRANGQTGLKIKDSSKFVSNVVGQLPEISIETIRRAIKGMMMSSIKECIAIAIAEHKVSILEISTKLTELSNAIISKLNARVADLGIELNHFAINSISASESDLEQLRKTKAEMLKGFSEADIEAYKISRISEARAKARETEGYTYADERKFDVLEEAAKNANAPAFAGNAVNQMGNQTLNAPASNPAPAQSTGKTCPECGAQVADGAKFCMNCGKQLPVASFCPECGSKCAPGSKFCMNCGTKLG